MRDLLKAFTDLAGAVITIDALHTQHDTAQVITDRRDYVMTVKGNHPAVSSASLDHGRRGRRTIKAALAPAWIEFAGAAQVAQLRRTVTKKGKKIVEVVYLITSDRTAGPATLAAWTCGHWEIENKLQDDPFRQLMTTFRPIGGRLGRPDDVADAAEYFASDLAGWVSGQHLLVSGGALQ